MPSATESCSHPQRTFVTCVPIMRCTPEQSMHMNAPKLKEAHVGADYEVSEHTEASTNQGAANTHLCRYNRRNGGSRGAREDAEEPSALSSGEHRAALQPFEVKKGLIIFKFLLFHLSFASRTHT